MECDMIYLNVSLTFPLGRSPARHDIKATVPKADRHTVVTWVDPGAGPDLREKRAGFRAKYWRACPRWHGFPAIA